MLRSKSTKKIEEIKNKFQKVVQEKRLPPQ